MPLQIKHAHFIYESSQLAVLDEHNNLRVIDGDTLLAENISLMLRDERPLRVLSARRHIFVLSVKLSTLLLHVFDRTTLEQKREPIQIADCRTGTIGFLSSPAADFVLVLSGRSLVYFKVSDFTRMDKVLDHDYERLECNSTFNVCFLVSSSQIAKVSKLFGSDIL